MTSPTLSCLTIARGRAVHLANVIRGLARQNLQPAELIIGVMQDAPYGDLPDAPFPIRQILVPGELLPLAAARNAAARAASGDVLVFLDVDCIPDPGLTGDYVAALERSGGGVVMGEVAYLPGGATDEGLDFDRFAKLAVRHSDRQGPPDTPIRRCEDYRCFWSLNFAMTRADWERSGGFDEGYVGYGAEDTDFARSLDARGIPIWWCQGARVFHQYHPHAMPPVHHLRSILRNSEHFASRWGHRTMEHWLHAFRLMGLIENSPTGLRILREPSEADFALCRQHSDQPYASTRRVIDHLQGLAAEDRAGEARVREVEREQSDLLHVAAE